MSATTGQNKEAANLTSTLGPIIFQVSLEQSNIKDLFSLLKKIFNVFDTNANGEISKDELQVLVDLELIDKDGAKRLMAFDTNKDKVIQFSEFASFFASEFLSNSAKPLAKAVGGTSGSASKPAGATGAAATATAPTATSPTTDSKTTPKGRTVGELEQVPLPSKFQTALPPLVFRLMCRETDLRRIFGLFQKMFAAFDQNADGKIELKELTRLVEFGFLGPEELAEFKQHATVEGTLDFTRFVSFWISHYLETAPLSKEEENVLSSALGPIVFKIALESENIRTLFALLNQLFAVFDSNGNGQIEKAELKTLMDCELLDERGLKRLLTWDTNHDQTISFTEFCAFVAAEMLRQNVELLSGSQNVGGAGGATSPKPLPAKWDKLLPPLLFRLATRQSDMVRIFNLFHKMFDIFDSNKDGKIDKREMQKLIQLELLQQKDMDSLMKWKTKSGDAVRFNEFIAWWISCAAQDGILEAATKHTADSKAAPAASDKKSAAAAPAAAASAGSGSGGAAAAKPAAAASAGGGGASAPDRTKLIAPILLRLAAQRDEIKKTFDLLQSLFRALDENKDGQIDATEMANLLKDQLIDQQSLKKLTTFDANRDGKISFAEYLAFIADSLIEAGGKL